MPTQPASSRGASLTVTSKGQVTLRKELLAHLGIEPGQRLDVEVLPGGRLELHAEQATGTIDSFIGLLAGRSSHRASLEELQEASSAGWAGLPCGERKPGSASL
jgi:AbrB family looped-hinge helix DNA binding protein